MSFGGLSKAVEDRLQAGSHTIVENSRDLLLDELRQEEARHEKHLRHRLKEEEQAGAVILKQPFCILCRGTDVTSEDAHTVSGRKVHAHAACIEALRRSLEQPEKRVQKARPKLLKKSCSVPFQVCPSGEPVRKASVYAHLVDYLASDAGLADAVRIVEYLQEQGRLPSDLG